VASGRKAKSFRDAKGVEFILLSGSASAEVKKRGKKVVVFCGSRKSGKYIFYVAGCAAVPFFSRTHPGARPGFGGLLFRRYFGVLVRVVCAAMRMCN